MFALSMMFLVALVATMSAVLGVGTPVAIVAVVVTIAIVAAIVYAHHRVIARRPEI